MLGRNLDGGSTTFPATFCNRPSKGAVARPASFCLPCSPGECVLLDRVGLCREADGAPVVGVLTGGPPLELDEPPDGDWCDDEADADEPYPVAATPPHWMCG